VEVRAIGWRTSASRSVVKNRASGNSSRSAQHERFVIEIGAEYPDRPDGCFILPAQLRIDLLYAVGKTPQVIELPLPFGAILRPVPGAP